MSLPSLRRGLVVVCGLLVASLSADVAFAQVTVSGTITANGSGVSGARAQLFNASTGNSVFPDSPQTSANGVFTISNVQPGSYFVVTSNGSGLINQVRGAGNSTVQFSGGSMVGTYQGLSPLVVGGSAITGIDFQLQQGGTISGTLLAAGGGTVSFASIRFYSSTGSEVGSTGAHQTTGAYTSPGLPAGQYRVRTSNNSGYVDQVHPATTCLQCPGTAGDLVTVTVPGNTPNINFTLSLGGSITGTVTNASTTAAIQNVQVSVYSSTGTFLKSAQTNASGVYTVGGLPTGDYRARTSNTAGFIHEAYDNIPCNNCANTTGALIGVTGGSSTANINFALAPGATVSGTITNASTGNPLSGVSVNVFSSTGTNLGNTQTNASGVYSVGGLPAGDVRVRTSNNAGFIDEAYDNIPCSNCPNTTGDLITLAAGATRANTNFALTPGAGFTGTVTNASGGTGLANITVNVYSSTGTFLRNSSPTGVAGTFSVAGLPAGQYRVRTSNNAGFIDEAYDNIACFGCSNTLGDLLTLTEGQTRANTNFALTAGATVSGTVTNADGGAGLNFISVSVYSSTGTFLKSSSTNASGVYSVTGLPAGQHRVKTSNSSGFIDEAYNDIPCLGCSNTTGDLITLTAGQTNTINFALTPGGTITGTVTSTADGAAISGAGMNIVNASNQSIGKFATTNASGVFSFTGLPAGTYYIRTSNSSGFIDEAYDNLACSNCNSTAGTGVVVAAGATVSNINFALAPGARISGTVTNAATEVPVQNVSVSFYNGTGQFVGSASTNASGVFSSSGLQPGTYFVATSSNSAGLINKLFDNVSCLNCPVTSGTPVVLAAGDLFTGANFALVPGGRISGAVTSLASGLPITNGNINILNAAGNQVANANLNFSTGAYETSGLAPGTYYVKSNVFSGGFINQLYDAKICVNCNVAEVGTPVTVTGTDTTPNINFALPTGGSITGTLTDAGNAAVAGVSVEVYDGTSFVTSSPPSASNGTFTISGLSAGNFYVKTRGSNGYIGVIYDGATGTVCLGCTHATTGTLVPVTVGATTSGINMQLTLGGQITGTVTNASDDAPIASLSVTLTDGNGTFLNSAPTNASGMFTLTGLPAGTYYLRTSNNQGFIDELFDNIPCSGFCGNAVGTPIVLTTGGSQTANMSLAPGGKIGGRVTNTNGQPLGHTSSEPVSVSIYNGAGSFITSANTNDAGNYLTSVGLPAGTYFARVNATGYIGELYDNVLCTNCFVTGGAPITVSAGATTTGIDFSLAQGGRVTGRIVDNNGNGIEGVRVNLTDVATNMSGGSGTTAASGVYSVFGVPTGTYVAKTSNSVGFIDEIYNDIKCTTCNVATTGQPLAVTAGQTVADINFGLDRGGRISGRVTNASSTNLSGVSVGVYDSLNRFVTSTVTNFDGTYATGGLVPGQYFVRTTFNNYGLVNELYNDLPCLSCMAGAGTPVVIDTTETEGNINFSLAAGGSITGRVADAGDAPLSNVRVDIYDGNNSFVGGTSTSSNGTYTVGGLQTGTYYAKTFNARGLIDKLYNDVTCVSCSVTGGAPIAVTVGASTANINFVLASGGGISGTISDLEGATLAGVSLQVFSGNGEFLQTLSTDGLGRYATTVGLAPGRYFVRTNTTLGYVNELYDNIPCANCPVTGGTAVVVTGSAVTTDVNFSLAVGGSITGMVTSTGGAPLENISVVAFLPSGSSAGSGLTNSLGAFRLSGLPSGSYFLRTFNAGGFTDQLFDGRSCAACNPTTGTPVAVQIAQATGGINFSLAPGGRISGTVTAAGSTTPIPGVTVEVFSASGAFVTSGVTDGLGRYTTFSGLATGTYYARSVNANGFVDEVYNDTTCAGCNATIGQPITVTAGSITANINFGLVLGGRISGTVVLEGTTTPIPNARVDVFTSTGVFAGSSFTGTSGRYLTGTGLPTGNYHVKVSSPQGHISEVYNDVSCSACSPITGAPLSVTAGATTTGIDFSLALGGLITGTIIETSTGGQLKDITVLVFNANNNLVSTARSDASGRFTSGSGLPAGTYYAKTANNQGFVDKAYNDVICLAGCKASVAGAGIVVVAGQPTSGIDFSLARGGRLAGTVTDVATGVPLANVSIGVFDAAGKLVARGNTDNAGNYLTFEGLPTGTYFARTDNGLGYVNKLYDDALCVTCDTTRGAPITVTAGATTPGINFALPVGGGISGTITDESNGQPLANIKVALYTQAGSLVGSGTSDGAGRFESGLGLAPGQYFLRTFNLQGLVDEAYNNRACAPCPITESTAITVTAGQTTTGLDFALALGGLVSGYVTDGATNAPLEGVTVSFFTTSGVFVGRSEPSDSSGYYAISLPVGTYQVQADPKDGYTPTANVGRARTPAVANALATVTVNLGQETTGVTFPLAVCAPPVLSPLSLGIITRGMAYSRTLTASGTGPFTFSVAEGLLPPGLTLDTATGVLSGTPTTLGTANFTLAAAGADSCPGTQTYAQLTCGITLGAASTSIPAGAGTGTVGLTADATDCAWAATSNASWITVTSGTGAGNGAVALSFAANSATTARVGTVTIAGETFTVTQAATPDVVPAITTQPTSTAITRAANASFTAAADGLPVPTLQWQISTDGGVSYTNVPDAAPFSGITTGTLTITGAPVGLTGARFRVVATSTAGTATSNAAILTVYGDLSMTPGTLRFTAVKAGPNGAISTVSAPQVVTVASTGAGPAWTAASNQSWLQITNGTGTGAGTFSASIANPANVIGSSASLTATITLTAPTAGSTTSVTVVLTVQQPGESAGPIGQVDTPLQNAAGITGAFGVTGWAVDDLGVTSVRIYRDCFGMDVPANCHLILGRRVVLVGDAGFVPGARPDVEAAFPTYPQRHVAGWGMQILSNSLPHVPNGQPNGGQGPMTLYVVATDIEGNMKLLGRSADPSSPDYEAPTTITLTNDTIAKPFGTLDTPAQGSTVSGTVANFGWVLTPDTNTTAGDPDDILLATSGAGIVVYVDGLPRSLVTYNQCRGTVGNPVPAGVFCDDDVANIFGNTSPLPALTTRGSNPTRYRNLDAARAAIGAFLLDSTTLSNGLHTIAWGVVDSAGRGEAIGSRFFTVLNGSTDAPIADSAPAARPAATSDTPAPVEEGVRGRTGYGLDGAWKRMFADSSGTYNVRLAEGGRLELLLGAAVDAGYLIANGERTVLPVGATLNGNHFAWMPPMGYVGPYTLRFIRGEEQIDVLVTVAPQTPTPPGTPEVRMNVDAVQVGASASERSVRVEGWAFDPKAAIESGIGAVHVWAKPVAAPGASSVPAFLGAATLDVARPDVAGALAGAPAQPGFQLVAALGVGTWEVSVYVWNERTARWEDARTTTVTIR